MTTMFSKISSRLFSLSIVTKLSAITVPKTPNCFLPSRGLKTTCVRHDLMEFFDDKKCWGEKKVKVGRAWLVDELRLKSNVELHKLWYVLLKEKNMLMSMEHDAKKECEYFPNPERYDKVEISMENLEAVVRERNQAYFLLETGTTGERSGEEVENVFGFPEYRQFEEHHVPMHENQQYMKAKDAEPKSSDLEKRKFFGMLRTAQRRRKTRLQRYHVARICSMLADFPDCDHEALREKYPLVDDRKFESILRRRKEMILDNNDVHYFRARWKNSILNRTRLSWKEKYGM